MRSTYEQNWNFINTCRTLLLMCAYVTCVLAVSGCGGNGAGTPQASGVEFQGNADPALVERATAYAKLMQATNLDSNADDFRHDFEGFLKPDARGGRAANIAFSKWTGSGMPIQSCRLVEIALDENDPNKSRVVLEAVFESEEPSDATEMRSTWHKLDGQWYLDESPYVDSSDERSDSSRDR